MTKDTFGSTVMSQATSNQLGDKSEHAATEANQPKVMTVGYIDSKLLNLIPFYDLYHLKEKLQTRYNDQCKHLKSGCKSWYSDIIGRLK